MIWVDVQKERGNHAHGFETTDHASLGHFDQVGMQVSEERRFAQFVPAYVNLMLVSQNNTYFPGIFVRKPFQRVYRFHLPSFNVHSSLEVESGLQCTLYDLSVGICQINTECCGKIGSLAITQINLVYQASHEFVEFLFGNDLLQTIVLFKLGIFANQSSFGLPNVLSWFLASFPRCRASLPSFTHPFSIFRISLTRRISDGLPIVEINEQGGAQK